MTTSANLIYPRELLARVRPFFDEQKATAILTKRKLLLRKSIILNNLKNSTQHIAPGFIDINDILNID